MGLLVFSMVVCVVAMGVGWGLGKRPGIQEGIMALSIGFATAGVFLMIPLFLYFAAGSFVLAVILAVRPCSNLWFVRGGLLLVTLVSVGISASQAYQSIRMVQRLRERFPKVSVESRLAYEHRFPATTFLQHDTIPLPLSTKVETRLAGEEAVMGGKHFGHHRARTLRELHAQYSDDFALAQNFGVSRMGKFGYYMLLSRPPQAPHFPRPRKVSEMHPDVATASPPSAPSGLSLTGLHDQSKYYFLDPDYIGYVESINSVAGFIPHRFTRVPSLDHLPDSLIPPSRWIVTRINLIGILKSEKPRVYVTEEFPDMAKLENVPVRELDAFEMAGLAKLRTEEDVVTEEHPARIRMVGSLRAGETCLKCHAVERGELLGAFTYEIEPGIEVQKPEKKETEALLRKRTLLLSVGRM